VQEAPKVPIAAAENARGALRRKQGFGGSLASAAALSTCTHAQQERV